MKTPNHITNARSRISATHFGYVVVAFILVLTVTGCSSTVNSQTTDVGRDGVSQETIAMASFSDSTRPKNVILLISDGCGPASIMMARDFARATGVREQLYLDEILVGAIRVSSANREVTDSAAGATAFSCGVKTNHQAVGVDAAGNPVKSILELAEDLGMATGVLATKSITDATPAAFTAHVAHRYDDEPEIASQQIDGGFDLLFGGGLKSFLPKSDGGNREDDRNLLEEATKNGYQVVTDRAAWDAIDHLPVLALMADKHLNFEIDRDPAAQPSFPEIVTKALDLLDDDPDGFFLMAEGSLIDIAAHSNDAAAHAHDILAYDDGVKVALDFAKRTGNTLVVSVSDHETGGLTVGRSYRWYPERLAAITASHDKVAAELKLGENSIEAIIKQYFGITDLSDAEVRMIADAASGNALNGALSSVVSDRISVDWTSFGHTGVDVNVYAFGPGSDQFRGNNDNTEIGKVLHRLLAK